MAHRDTKSRSSIIGGIGLLNLKKPPLTYRRAVDVVIGLFCLLGCWAAYPLSTDKDQPIEVEADEAELDDLKDVSIYRGNVIVRQGSIHMTGDVMTVHTKGGNELDHLVIEGNPATYKQLPDNSTVHDQAKAMRMEYYELKNMVVLIRDACVKQDTATLVGERIEYNTELSRVRAWNRPGGSEAQATPETEKESRVTLTIKKKEDGSQKSLIQSHECFIHE